MWSMPFLATSTSFHSAQFNKLKVFVVRQIGTYSNTDTYTDQLVLISRTLSFMCTCFLFICIGKYVVILYYTYVVDNHKHYEVRKTAIRREQLRYKFIISVLPHVCNMCFVPKPKYQFCDLFSHN
jgi:hypothetical protein